MVVIVETYIKMLKVKKTASNCLIHTTTPNQTLNQPRIHQMIQITWRLIPIPIPIYDR